METSRGATRSYPAIPSQHALFLPVRSQVANNPLDIKHLLEVQQPPSRGASLSLGAAGAGGDAAATHAQSPCEQHDGHAAPAAALDMDSPKQSYSSAADPNSFSFSPVGATKDGDAEAAAVRPAPGSPPGAAASTKQVELAKQQVRRGGGLLTAHAHTFSCCMSSCLTSGALCGRHGLFWLALCGTIVSWR